MCGICGVLDYTGGGRVDRRTVEAMSAMLGHRGPDASGYYQDDYAALAHRRLSIIDVEGGAQPMTNEDGTIWIVYNGELYNFRELRVELAGKGHRFATSSDTEVIVHLYEEYGSDAVRRMNGMFAFALWDSVKKKLLIARDRLGIKPLYYAERGGLLYFASELRPVAAHAGVGDVVNPRALCRYLLLQYTPGPETILGGVYKLPPGSMAVAGSSGLSIKQYWAPNLSPGPDAGGAGLSGKLRDALDASVDRQLVSDVPLGAFLSGGLDSGMVVALMGRRKAGRIKTFSLGFEGPDAFDERKYARAVARRLGTEHYETSLSPRDFAELMPVVVAAMDEPLADPATVPTYKISRLARDHVTVVMTGEGGDELFGGYRRYRLEKMLGGLASGPVAGRLARWAASNLTGSDRRYMKAARAISSDGWAGAHLNWVSVFLDEELRGVAPDVCAGAWQDTVGFIETTAGSGNGRLERMIACDLKTWLVDDLLAKVDRMSMAVSLEARVPYLDNEVVDIALALGMEDRIRGGRAKHVLKEAAKGLLPADIIDRKKRGFDLPLAVWFRGPLRDYIHDTLGGGGKGAYSAVDGRYAGRMLDEHTSGKRDWALPLFSLLVLKEWSDRSGV